MTKLNETAKIAGKDSACPKCGGKGKAVQIVTLKALLKPEVQTKILSAFYWFFLSEDCEVVYFAESGNSLFTKADLTVRVGIKEKRPPRQVCYCFNHTSEEIEDEVQRTGKTTVLDDIKSRMKVACWCETKSPLGSCCLATVTKYVKQTLASHGKGTDNSAVAHTQEDCCAGQVHHAATVPENKAARHADRLSRAERIAWIGSFTSAVMASACCWLPLLLLAFGMSGIAVSTMFEKYRPIFMFVTFAFLGMAFYFAYRPRHKAANASVTQEGDFCCAVPAAGSDCCPPTDQKWTLQKFNRAMLWIVTAIVLAFVFFPNYVGVLLRGRHDASFTGRFQNVETRTILIAGMTCEACVAHVEANLAKVAGVQSAEVSYKEQKAIVVVDVSVNQKALVKAVESAGYKVTTEVKKKL